MKHPIIYDLETYPNCFTATFLHAITGNLWTFESSARRDDIQQLMQFLRMLQGAQDVRLIGFNNLGFDYPILHMIILAQGVGINSYSIYEKVKQIISSQDGFGSTVRPHEVLIPQVDLFKIHHFDNKARSTSLKALEFNMRSSSVEDLPFPVGIELTPDQMDTLLSYNFHDVTETLKFYYESKAMIDFRDDLSIKYGRDHTNFNDTKIGKEYFISRLEERAPGCCFIPGTRQAVQTRRAQIRVADVIFPYIQFVEPEFDRIKNWMANQIITTEDIRGIFADQDTKCSVGGFVFGFGVGGLHGSVNGRSIHEDVDYCILDLDVAGYYPSLAIANRLHPAHLGELFCEVYQDITLQRRTFKKGTPENAMLKLAGNGVYGDSGNPYSPFYDLAYMLSITINGQLLLCMLAEQIIRVPSVELIQVNTDGMTIRVRRDQLPNIKVMTDWWQNLTKLTLEEGFYKSMFIRDVNAYLAVSEKKIKRKGPFSWVRGPNLSDGELAWHQDHSALIIPMAAEAALVDGANIAEFIHGHHDIFDFMIRAKVPRSSKLLWGDKQLPNITRYYVSTNGAPLTKIMPPAPGCRSGDYKRANGLTDAYFRSIENEIGGSQVWDERIHTKNKSRYAEKSLGIDVGFLTWPANRIEQAGFSNINYQYYIAAAQALVASVGCKEQI